MNQWSGVLCHKAGLTYDQKSWALETGHETAYDPENLAAGAGQKEKLVRLAMPKE
ncbi:hypothetical protein ACTL32_07860 [Planococcus sp. FY231025]|uniref:hypothetical protein n=1 Tax=Planococcus sp. FY231025 TaxID=3455699 RepID=UPI003F90D5D6